MNFVDLITPERVCIIDGVHSRKRAIETLAEKLAQAAPYLTAGDILDSLIARERIGSTVIGQGVAIPHTRFKGTDESIGAFIRLSEPVDFDAEDQCPVDLIFGLLVPDTSTGPQQALLQSLTAMFGTRECLTQLRQADTDKILLDTLIEYYAATTNHS